MTEPSVDERPPSTDRDHPPFRLRERRLVLLPDLRPPSVDEIRWAVRQRRVRRTPLAQTQSPEIVLPEAGEVAEAVAPGEPEIAEVEVEAAVAEPEAVADVATIEPELEIEPEPEPEPEPDDDLEFLDLHDPEFPDLQPWQPATESPADDDEPPLVSHLLVVRESGPDEPGRIAVLDEVHAEAPTITRLVPLPAEPGDDYPVEVPAAEDTYVEELEELEPDLEVVTEVDGRAAPLYWRLLRLRHTRPNGWLRALYFEGAVALGVVLVLAEAASVWTIVVLPLIVAVVVKANDVLAGNLRRTYRQPKRRAGS